MKRVAERPGIKYATFRSEQAPRTAIGAARCAWKATRSASRDTARAMSQENVEIVKRAVAAINQRDIDGYLACCTEDVRLVTPVADVGGAYDGPDGVRRFFTDIADASPDFKIAIESLEAVGPDRVLGFMSVTGTGRASGIPIENPTGNVYDLANGKIKRIRIFFDRNQALEAAGLSGFADQREPTNG